MPALGRGMTMQTAFRAIARVRWRILLPVLMLALSSFLMVLEKIRQPMIAGWGTGWEAPARVVNSLINGPGFYLSAHVPLPIPDTLLRSLNYDADRLLGIGFFWFLIGLSVDRRRSKYAIDQRHPISAGVMFMIAALFCAFFGVGGLIMSIRDPFMWRVITWHPFQTSETMRLGLELWLLIFSVYFARRAFIAVRRSLARAA